ncbi:MAG: DNA repair protein RadA [Sphaerochaetaceae bacterium]|nr:DNA repair protein RadA [Sphaerochaetaceae bacterium]
MKDLVTRFICSGCGRAETKWLGRCPDCGSWNSFVEEVVKKEQKSSKTTLVSDTNKLQPVSLSKVTVTPDVRFSTGITELDRVLGGGVMRGSAILLGGEPGIGKSTLMLQMLSECAAKKTLYVSGEESAAQVKLRAERLKVDTEGITIFSDTSLEELLMLMNKMKPEVMVVDSLQTLTSSDMPSIAGSVNQIRVCSMELSDTARQLGTALFLVGHVTKGGQIAGPKVIEHIVDTVLYFDQADTGVRIIRAAKNRYGTVDEIGIFLMGEQGLAVVKDPAGFFIGNRERTTLPPGIAYSAVIEGSRTFLVEIQALTVPAKSGYGRVYSERIDTAQVLRISAVLERHAQVRLSEQDVYVNVAGGIKLSEVSIELPLALALYSALVGKSLPANLVSFGELSLAGEIRPVGFVDRRAKGALDMGFKKLLLPPLSKAEAKLFPDGVICHRIRDAIALVSDTN